MKGKLIQHLKFPLLQRLSHEIVSTLNPGSVVFDSQSAIEARFYRVVNSPPNRVRILRIKRILSDKAFVKEKIFCLRW